MLFSRGLAEIVLIVKDVKASARFYREVVGLMPATEPDDEWAWFWAGPPGEAQRVAVHTGTLLFEDQSPLPGGKRWGPVHYALQVPPDKLQAAADHVRGQGVEVYGPVTFDWMKATSYYFYDPDGNLLEFWAPDPA
jgi:catechol 2,3-dioxygenase-like lactoylglutathione lyase family enzyme